jgi:dephospho-CoA kinase
MHGAFARSAEGGFMVIAIVGMPGSGKSLLSTHFSSKGFPTIRFGQVVIDELYRRGLDVNPLNEQHVREELRKTHGMDVCARRSLPSIHEALSTHPMVIIDGLYGWSEYKVLQSTFPHRLIVVAVVAARQVRYSRLQNRLVRPLNASEAERRDFAEIEELEKGGPIAIADFFLLNEGSEQDLHSKADALLPRLQQMNPKTNHVTHR